MRRDRPRRPKKQTTRTTTGSNDCNQTSKEDSTGHLRRKTSTRRKGSTRDGHRPGDKRSQLRTREANKPRPKASTRRRTASTREARRRRSCGTAADEQPRPEGLDQEEELLPRGRSPGGEKTTAGTADSGTGTVPQVNHRRVVTTQRRGRFAHPKSEPRTTTAADDTEAARTGVDREPMDASNAGSATAPRRPTTRLPRANTMKGHGDLSERIADQRRKPPV